LPLELSPFVRLIIIMVVGEGAMLVLAVKVIERMDVSTTT
jgi:hypothetical protein